VDGGRPRLMQEWEVANQTPALMSASEQRSGPHALWSLTDCIPAADPAHARTVENEAESSERDGDGAGS
jgi:hypothetical protein